jgi:PII-like signaling protein
MVHSEGRARHAGRPLHLELLRTLREARTAGATVLRGIRGFYGDQGPFADRVLSVRRDAPLLTVIVDTPARIRQIWPLVEALTDERGLITSELVPAFHREPALAGPRSRPRLARIWDERREPQTP